MERRLAAILAADVVGYSRLMGEDEAGTLAALKAHRQELIDPAIAKHKGRLVKLIGDGALVEFASAVDAVECAVAVQEGMAARNGGTPEDRWIVLRIGINIGDLIVEGDDLYGDGVNIAARLEGLAEPGGICVSRNVVNQVKAKVDFGFEDLGAQSVKNIAEPVQVFRVLPEPVSGGLGAHAVATSRWRRPVLAAAVLVIGVLAGLALWQRPWEPREEPASLERMAFPLPDKPSIAVLPLINLSGDPDQNYFVDGLTEDIITELSRFTELFVIARTSTFTYKDKAVPVGQIAEELGVRYVVEGSVRKTETDLLVTVQLIDATTGGHLWAERYERPITEFRALGDELLQTIVSTVASRVENVGRRIASRKRTDNLSAYELVLQGNALLDDYTEASNEAARARFEQAIALDPQYARAHEGYAATHMRDFLFGWSEDSNASLALGREVALKAVALDDTDYRTHQTLGWVYLYEKQFEKAMAEIGEGLSLNPNDAKVLAENSYALIYLGEMEKAVDQIQRAMRLDPLHPDWYFDAQGWAYYFLGRYKDALRVVSRIAEPTAGQHRELAAIYARLGQMDKAQAHAARVLELEPGFAVSIFSETMPFKDRAVLEDYLDGLRESGLPE